MQKCLIVAIADNNAIGRGGDLPWHISEDLRYFKAQTKGFPVIMGRKTYDSIGRPLPGRTNIVLSRQSLQVEGIELVRSLEEAYAAAAQTGAEKCFVMGGAAIYRVALDEMDLLYVTHVHTEIQDADAFFPEIDPEKWAVKSVSETHSDPETGYDYEFVVYERKLWK